MRSHLQQRRGGSVDLNRQLTMLVFESLACRGKIHNTLFINQEREIHPSARQLRLGGTKTPTFITFATFTLRLQGKSLRGFMG